ncbi:MAG TPA: hypothetical protein VI112_08430 [Bacteroidia bacterium]|jgi:hypothetical protein
MEPPKNAKVYEFPTSTIWFDEDGILYSMGKKAPAETIEESKRTLEQFKEIVGHKKVCMILDVTNAQPNNKETRDFAAKELPPLVKAMALISNSPLGRMMVNLFFGLKPPPYPARMCANEKEAKEWIRQYL